MPTALRAVPLPRLGAEVAGVSLRGALASGRAAALTRRLRPELDRHGLLLFRHQESLQPTDHLLLAECLGAVFPLPRRYQHVKAPHRDVLRMSNREEEGFTGVGTSGWHLDGISYDTPFGYSLLHICSASRDGPTHFLPLHPLAQRVRRQRPGWWERLSMRCGSGETAVHHPLLYEHPRTRRAGVALGKTSGLLRDRGTASEHELGAEETAATLEELSAHVEAHEAQHAYGHQWRAGDVLIVDNLAVAHLASPETQLPADEVGLRVLHRVVVAGGEALCGVTQEQFNPPPTQTHPNQKPRLAPKVCGLRWFCNGIFEKKDPKKATGFRRTSAPAPRLCRHDTQVRRASQPRPSSRSHATIVARRRARTPARPHTRQPTHPNRPQPTHSPVARALTRSLALAQVAKEVTDARARARPPVQRRRGGAPAAARDAAGRPRKRRAASDVVAGGATHGTAGGEQRRPRVVRLLAEQQQ